MKKQSKKKPPDKRPPAVSPGARRDWLILGAVLLLGLLARGVYLSELGDKPDFDQPLSDAQYNDYWARGWGLGQWNLPTGASDPEIGSTPFFRPPGYPAFLAAVYRVFGGSYWSPRVAQTLLGLASCVLGFLLGRSLYGRGAGLVGAALLAVYWGLIYFEGELQPPTLLVFLCLALMLVMRRWIRRLGPAWAIGGGVLLGLLAVIRPNVLLFVPVVLVWFWWILHRQSAVKKFPLTALATLTGLLVVIAPVTIRNFAVGDDLVLISSNGGVNLYIGNNPRTSLVTPRIPDIEQLAGRSGWSLFAYPDIIRGVEAQSQRSMKHSQISRYFSGRAFDFIRSNPAGTLLNALKRGLLLWGPREVSNNKVLRFERKNSAILWLLPGFPLAVSGFLLGLGLWLWEQRKHSDAKPTTEQRRRNELIVLILLFIVVYSASFMPFLAAGRFRVPLVPFLLLFTGYALFRLGQWLVSREYRPAVCCCISWLALYGLANVQLVSYEPDLGRWYLDRASAYAFKNQPERAIEQYRAAIAANPGYPEIYAELGSVQVTLGEFDDAIANYRKAIELNPSFVELRRTLAELLFHLDRIDECIAEYRAALELSPANAEAWYNLARAHRRQGSIGDTAAAYRQAIEHNPNHAEARVNLGVLLLEQRQTRPAEQEFRQALDINPNMFEAHYNLARALADQGQTDEALQSLSSALHIQPGNAAAQSAWKALQARRRQTKPPAEPSPPPTP